MFADQQTVRVEISCHNFNFKNFWGGEFLSTWVIDHQAQTLTGTIKIHNHYFEQGNIQFNMNKNFEASSLKSLKGKAVVEQIAKLETEVITQ